MRIYDTFLFDGELDLLTHRIKENWDYVDWFLLVEAEQTYRGEPKPCVFEAEKARFAWAADKIRHIKLQSLGPAGASPRTRAALQRNAVLLGLQDAAPEDIILLLDADEIPNAALLTDLRAQGLEKPRRLQMTRHYRTLDLLAPRSTCCPSQSDPFPFAIDHLCPGEWKMLDSTWSGQSGVAVPMSALRGGGRQGSPYELRYRSYDSEPIAKAGRHLTGVDPAAQLGRKLPRMFHEEWATDRSLHAPHLERCRLHAVHHRGWWYAERPGGRMPDDLLRLADNCPSAMRTEPLPSLWRRRLVRTWSWIRLWNGIPQQLVWAVDRHFETLVPLLFPVLTVADITRAALNLFVRQRGCWRVSGNSEHLS